MYEYVALSWDTHIQREDRRFVLARNQLLEGGWIECLQAAWRGSPGGACIMRRPKDEPRGRGFEYLLLDDKRSPEQTATKSRELLGYGWREWRTIPWSGMRAGGIRVFRRSKERDFVPKDEPRMWTEGEVEEVAKNVFAYENKFYECLLETAQTEAAMQTAYNKDLRKRNEEWQAAIDEVYATSKTPDVRGIKDTTLRAVRRCLRPLATKEENNG